VKTAVEDVEQFMKAAGQETPAGPTMTETAKLYFGDPNEMQFLATLSIDAKSCGLVGEEFAELIEAWTKKDDVGVLGASLGLIWQITAGLRSLGFPIEQGWAELVQSMNDKAEPNFRRVLNEHGLKAFLNMGGCIRAEPREPHYDTDPCTE
jgi:hypothetical protein